MKIIAQKSDISNSYDFFEQALSSNIIDGVSLNIAYTKDNQIVIFNTPLLNSAIVNTIENSNIKELENYEILKLDETLQNLENQNMKKSIYLNVIPFRTGIITDENIQEITSRINQYIDSLKEIVDNHPTLNINIHSISRNFVTILKQKIINHRIGFAVTGDDLTFIDVEYYVITADFINDNIINQLLNDSKEVLIYIASDYYLSYVYNHYLGKNSTPYLQEIFSKLNIITSYPEITSKVLTEN